MYPRSPWCWCHACWARRRRRTAIAIALLAVAAALLARSQSEHSGPRPARAPATRTEHTRKAPARRARATSPGAALAVAGQGLTWTDFHGIALPASANAGPRDTRGGLASGFADTPRGALLAAINIAVRTAAPWGPPVFGPTIARQVTGPDAGLLLRADSADYAQLRAAAHVRPGQPAGRGDATEAAYRFVAWAPAAATLDIVTAGPGQGGATALASTRIQVLWQDGDWRVVAPPGGDWAASATPISSLAGYTLFAGER